MVNLVVGWKSGEVFNPERLSPMIEAYELAWRALRFAFDEEYGAEASRARALLAAAVLKHSRADRTLNAADLCRKALEEMPPYTAAWIRPDQRSGPRRR